MVRSEPQTIFRLAAAVEDWPRLLPHYSWVRVVRADDAVQRTVEMAARRDVLGSIGIPLRWTAVQTLHPERGAIEFEHIRGISRGMRVTWTIEPSAIEGEARVEIQHAFTPDWPVPDALVHAIVGEYFVNGVARRTLAHLAGLAERTS
jgi:ribosome-associated toxin RatA of RatAB toxin-antitoxin module